MIAMLLLALQQTPGFIRLQDSSLVHVEQPQVVIAGGELILIGATTTIQGERQRGGDSAVGGFYTGVRRDATGTWHLLPAVGPLNDQIRLNWPRAVSDGDTVHVVWGVESPGGVAESRMLLYSRLHRGRWLSRDTIASGRYEWATVLQSQLIRVADSLFFAVKDLDHEFRGVEMFRRIGGRWSQRSVQLPHFGNYVALQAVPGYAALAWVGGPPDSLQRRHRNAVNVVVSTNGWESFVGPTVLAVSGRNEFHETQMQVAANGDFLVLWAMGGDPASMDRTHAFIAVGSPDDVWTLRSGFAPPSGLRGLRSSPSATGLWYTFDSPAEDVPGTVHWADGVTCVLSMDGEGIVTAPSILFDGRSVHLFWTQHWNPLRTMAVTRTASIDRFCPPIPR